MLAWGAQSRLDMYHVGVRERPQLSARYVRKLLPCGRALFCGSAEVLFLVYGGGRFSVGPDICCFRISSLARVCFRILRAERPLVGHWWC